MKFASLFLLAFAVSLDGFGVGMTYGLRKIRFPWWSLAIVTFFSASMILLAMGLGGLIVMFVSPSGARWIGAGILIAIGGWAIGNVLSKKDRYEQEESQSGDDSQSMPQVGATVPMLREAGASARTQPEGSKKADLSKERRVFRLELQQVGLVIQILKTPTAADMDHSGSISASEAIFLGLALSMDAFGAGLGASLVGYPPVDTVLSVSLMSLLFITLGIKIGYKYAETAIIRRMVYIPGIMLIVIGLSKILS